MKKILVGLLFSFVVFSVHAQEVKGEFVSLQEDIDAACESYGTTLEKFNENAANVEAYHKYEVFEKRFTALNRQMSDMDYRLKTELSRRNTNEINKIQRELKRSNQQLGDLKAEYDEWISGLSK